MEGQELISSMHFITEYYEDLHKQTVQCMHESLKSLPIDSIVKWPTLTIQDKIEVSLREFHCQYMNSSVALCVNCHGTDAQDGAWTHSDAVCINALIVFHTVAASYASVYG